MPTERLIYLNLAIDQAWDSGALDTIFPVKNPRNQAFLAGLEQLAFFHAKAADLVLLREMPDPDFVAYLGGLGIRDFRFKHVDDADGKFSECIFAGVSELEERLHLMLMGKPPQFSAEFFRSLNDKFLLPRLAKEIGFPFPETTELTISAATEFTPPPGDWILKGRRSSGGSGLVDPSAASFLLRAAQRTKRDTEWLLQRKHRRVEDYYTLCEISPAGETEVSELFTLAYDKNLSSWRHESRPADPALTAAALAIGAKLHELGYYGSFGLDAFLDAAGVLFPAIDLNVRVDKCRMIRVAAARLGLPSILSQKRRLKDCGAFAELWKKLRKKLELDERGRAADGRFCLPYLFTAYDKDAEIAWFCSPGWEATTLSAVDSLGSPLI